MKLFNVSVKNPTKVNGVPIEGECLLQHGDVFTIIDRSFRYESTIEAQIAEAVRGFELCFFLLVPLLSIHLLDGN